MPQSLSEKLQSYRPFIFNSEDPIIDPLLAEEGIEAEDIAQGKALYDETIVLFENQQKEYQEQSADNVISSFYRRI